MNKLTIFGIIFLLSISFTYAVLEETDDYRIECTPDVASIKSNGFNQECSFTWKGIDSKLLNIGYCFNTEITTNELKSKEELKTELKTSLVKTTMIGTITKVESIKDDKGKEIDTKTTIQRIEPECYNLYNITLESNVSKVLKLSYMPNDNKVIPKWSAYIDDVKSSGYDLILDPVYNTSLYEIGTSRSSDYYWSQAFNGYVDSVSGGTQNYKTNNTDINNTNAYLTQGKATTNNSYYYKINTTAVNSNAGSSAVWGLSYNETVNHSIEFIRYISYMSGYCDLGVYQKTSLSVKYQGEAIINIGSTALGGGSSTCRVKDISWALNPEKIVEYYEVYQLIDLNNRYGGIYNVSAIYGDNVTRTSANLTSNNIALPILVNNFRLNASFTGQAFINITFDGINYNYLNLTNGSLIPLSDSLVDNSNLSYRLHLLNNLTTIYNLSIEFNGINNRWDIYIYNESTNTLLTQNVTVTLTDLTNSTIRSTTTTSGNLTFTEMPLENVLEIRVSSQNYSTKTYYRTDFNTTYNRLNAYLIPVSIAQNFSICWYDYSGAVVSNLHVYQYYLSSTGYVLSQDVFTDIQGKSILVFNPSSYYLYNYSNSAGSQTFSVVSFILNPPQNSVFLADGCNYDVTLKSAASLINYTTWNIVGQHSFNNATKILNFSYVSVESGLTYSYLVYHDGAKVCNGTSLLSSNSFACNLTTYSGNVYVYGLANNIIFYTGTENLYDTKLGGFLSIEEASFLSGIIFLVILIAGASLGVIVSIIFSVAALVIIMWLGLLSSLGMGGLAVACVVGIIIGVVIRRYR